MSAVNASGRQTWKIVNGVEMAPAQFKMFVRKIVKQVAETKAVFTVADVALQFDDTAYLPTAETSQVRALRNAVAYLEREGVIAKAGFGKFTKGARFDDTLNMSAREDIAGAVREFFDDQGGYAFKSELIKYFDAEFDEAMKSTIGMILSDFSIYESYIPFAGWKHLWHLIEKERLHTVLPGRKINLDTRLMIARVPGDHQPSVRQFDHIRNSIRHGGLMGARTLMKMVVHEFVLHPDIAEWLTHDLERAHDVNVQHPTELFQTDGATAWAAQVEALGLSEALVWAWNELEEPTNCPEILEALTAETWRAVGRVTNLSPGPLSRGVCTPQPL